MAPSPARALRAPILLLTLLVMAPAVEGQAGPTLRWPDLLTRLEAQPELAAAQADLAAAEGELRAIGLPNPELEWSGGRAESLEGEGGEAADVWEWSASLPLRPWGPWRHERAAARAESRAAAQEVLFARREQERQLAVRFWKVVHDERQRAVLAERERQIERLVEIARLRADLGEARPSEPLRLEIEREELAAELRAAEAEAILNREALGRRLGLEPPGDFSVEADWDSLPPLPEGAVAPTQAHPLLAAETARGESAAAALAAARAERWPGLRVGGFKARELVAESEGLSLALELPLFDRRGGGVDRARAAATAAGHRRAALARDLADALAAAASRARVARQRALGLREEILPRAARALDVLEQEYRVGEAGLVDLLDARRERSRIESAQLAAQLDYHLALADLKALAPGDDHD
jgi:cobalt-zinc-cadmium efflux system outer membrane protein